MQIKKTKACNFLLAFCKMIMYKYCINKQKQQTKGETKWLHVQTSQ